MNTNFIPPRPTEAELQEAMRRKIDEIDEAARVNTENVKRRMRERALADEDRECLAAVSTLMNFGH